MPYYLQLCVETWKQIPNADIRLLNYKSLREYIDIDAYGSNLFSGAFAMAQIADSIRAMLLEKFGGVWLDVDIIVTKPEAGKFFTRPQHDITLFGNRARKTTHISLIAVHRPGTLAMINWVAFNKVRIWNLPSEMKTTPWGYVGGDFLEPYAYSHLEEIEILDYRLVHPKEQIDRAYPPDGTVGQDYRAVYEDYFFMESHHLAEIPEKIVVLNNTWTPQPYKNFNRDELLRVDCTVSNLLAEILDLKRPTPEVKFYRSSRP